MACERLPSNSHTIWTLAPFGIIPCGLAGGGTAFAEDVIDNKVADIRNFLMVPPEQ